MTASKYRTVDISTYLFIDDILGYVAVFMLYLHTKFKIPSSSGLLLTTAGTSVKPKFERPTVLIATAPNYRVRGWSGI